MLEIDEPGEKPIKGELLAPHFVLAYAARSSDASAFLNLASNKRQKSRTMAPRRHHRFPRGETCSDCPARRWYLENGRRYCENGHQVEVPTYIAHSSTITNRHHPLTT
jgi:hypothetical protein